MTTSEKMQIVITLGQSLTQGAWRPATAGIITSSPQNPNKILALDFGTMIETSRGWQSRAVDEAMFRGFTHLQETRSETHVSGMMSTIADHLQTTDPSITTLLHINSGANGRSIFELSLSDRDIFDTLNNGIASTSSGDLFGVFTTSGIQVYIREDTNATFIRSIGTDVQIYDNLEIQLRLAVQAAKSANISISEKVVFNWVQGQADGNSPLYGRALNYLLDKFSDSVSNVLGDGYNAITAISQFRGYGTKNVSAAQIEAIVNRDDVVLGALEYKYQSQFPSQVDLDYTHLSAEGYFRFGQDIGRNIAQALQGKENKPIIMQQIVQLDIDTIEVFFANVDGRLVEDSSIFSLDSHLRSPDFFGFGSYRLPIPLSRLTPIASAAISGSNSVKIDFSLPIIQPFDLWIGNNDFDVYNGSVAGYSLRGYGGTTLRDSAGSVAAQPFGNVILDDHYLYDFIPIQKIRVNPNAQNLAPLILNGGTAISDIIDKETVFIQVSDDFSSIGSGISISIVDGDYSDAFYVDGSTGRLGVERARAIQFQSRETLTVMISVKDVVGSW